MLYDITKFILINMNLHYLLDSKTDVLIYNYEVNLYLDNKFCLTLVNYILFCNNVQDS